MEAFLIAGLVLFAIALLVNAWIRFRNIETGGCDHVFAVHSRASKREGWCKVDKDTHQKILASDYFRIKVYLVEKCIKCDEERASTYLNDDKQKTTELTTVAFANAQIQSLVNSSNTVQTPPSPTSVIPTEIPKATPSSNEAGDYEDCLVALIPEKKDK